MGERTILTDDGVRLYVAVEGDGPPLVLCHGGPGLWDYFGPVVEAVRDLATVITWDQRGCGRSTEAGSHQVARYVRDLEAIRQELGCSRWVVGGHSWGASLALMYALEHPSHCDGLVYISGTGLGIAWNAAYHHEFDRRRGPDTLTRLAELRERDRSPEEEHEYRVLTWSSDFADQHRAAQLAASLDRPFTINYAANAALGAETKTWSEADLADRCRSLEIPVLIVHGELDPRPAWAFESLSTALPDVRFETLPGSGHVPWLEAKRLFDLSVRQFLTSLG